MEIRMIRGVFMVLICKTGIYEINGNYFLYAWKACENPYFLNHKRLQIPNKKKTCKYPKQRT